MLYQQVVIIADRSGGGVFNRKDAVIRPSFLHLDHSILHGLYVIHIRLPAEILKSRPVAVGAFHTLIGDADIFPFQILDHGKTHIHGLAVSGQKAVLESAADGHDLGKQFIGAFPGKIAVRQGGDGFQLLFFPCAVINRFARMYFIFSYLSAQFHSFLKQLRQLGIHHIQLLTDVLQIQFLHLCPSNSSTMSL